MRRRNIIITVTAIIVALVAMVLVLDSAERNRSVDVAAALDRFYGYRSYVADITYKDVLLDQTVSDRFFYEQNVGWMKVSAENAPQEFSTQTAYLRRGENRWQVSNQQLNFVPGSAGDLLQASLEEAKAFEWKQSFKDLICAELDLDNRCVVLRNEREGTAYQLYADARSGEIRAIKLESSELVAEYALFEVNSSNIDISGKLKEATNEE